MLLLDLDDDEIVYLAIDPSTTAMGVAILKVDGISRNLIVMEALTFYADQPVKNTPYYRNVSSSHGDLYGRLHAMRRYLDEVIQQHRPHICICESPFLGQSIDGYAKLTEAVFLVRQAIIAYDIYVPVYMVPPQSVKKEIGSLAQTDTKEGVLPALKRLVSDPLISNLYITEDIDLDSLSEHAIDAIAIGYTQYRSFKTVDDIIEEATYVYK